MMNEDDEKKMRWNLKCKTAIKWDKSSCDLISSWSQIQLYEKCFVIYHKAVQVKTMHQSRLHRSNQMSKWITCAVNAASQSSISTKDEFQIKWSKSSDSNDEDESWQDIDWSNDKDNVIVNFFYFI